MIIETTIILNEDERKALEEAIDYFRFKMIDRGKHTFVSLVAHTEYETYIDALQGILERKTSA